LRQVFHGVVETCVVVEVTLGAVVVVVVVSADATAGALRPRAAITATATTPRVLNFFMWTPFKGTGPTVKLQILKTL
jgi:hypothetical protein